MDHRLQNVQRESRRASEASPVCVSSALIAVCPSLCAPPLCVLCAWTFEVPGHALRSLSGPSLSLFEFSNWISAATSFTSSSLTSLSTGPISDYTFGSYFQNTFLQNFSSKVSRRTKSCQMTMKFKVWTQSSGESACSNGNRVLFVQKTFQSKVWIPNLLVFLFGWPSHFHPKNFPHPETRLHRTLPAKIPYTDIHMQTLPT